MLKIEKALEKKEKKIKKHQEKDLEENRERFGLSPQATYAELVKARNEEWEMKRREELAKKFGMPEATPLKNLIEVELEEFHEKGGKERGKNVFHEKREIDEIELEKPVPIDDFGL